MDQRNQRTEGTDHRNTDERRRDDRRHSTAGVRPGQVERRRSNRRNIAGAGLMAALALGGVRYQQQRPEPMEDVAWAPDELLLDDDVESTDDLVLDGDVDAREALEPIIQEAAALHGVDADLVKAVIQTESRFDPRAQSGAGARGLMQLMPRTAKAVGIEDPFNPRQNIFGGVKYLSQMLERYNGNTALALAAYNAGPGNVRRYRGVPPFRETRGYVSKIAKLVADSDAAFAVPTYRAPAKKARVSSRSKRRAANVRKASMSSRAKASRAKVTRTSVSKKKAASRASSKTKTRRSSRSSRT